MTIANPAWDSSSDEACLEWLGCRLKRHDPRDSTVHFGDQQFQGTQAQMWQLLVAKKGFRVLLRTALRSASLSLAYTPLDGCIPGGCLASSNAWS